METNQRLGVSGPGATGDYPDHGRDRPIYGTIERARRHLLRYGFGASALVAAAAVISLAAGGSEAPGRLPASPPAPQVSVAQVISRQVTPWDEFTGHVEAVQSVDLRPRVTGYVERVAFQEGQMVRRGDLLFVIDARSYRAEHERAAAELARAQSEAALARSQDARTQALVAAKAASREEADARHAALAQSLAAVRAAQAAATRARLDLGFTEVRSPIDGRAGRALLTVGNLAQADATVLTTVVSVDPVHVYFEGDEQAYLRYLDTADSGQRAAVGSPVRIGLADETGYPHAGTLDFIDNQVDPRTGTIRARAVVANPDHTLTPGLFARVQMAGGGAESALLVDEKSVLTDQDRKYVYVLGPHNVAVRKDIELGRRVDGLRIVRAGLAPGDIVIVQGVQKVFFAGMPVAPTVVAMGASPSGQRVATSAGVGAGAGVN